MIRKTSRMPIRETVQSAYRKKVRCGMSHEKILKLLSIRWECKPEQIEAQLQRKPYVPTVTPQHPGRRMLVQIQTRALFTTPAKRAEMMAVRMNNRHGHGKQPLAKHRPKKKPLTLRHPDTKPEYCDPLLEDQVLPAEAIERLNSLSRQPGLHAG